LIKEREYMDAPTQQRLAIVVNVCGRGKMLVNVVVIRQRKANLQQVANGLLLSPICSNLQDRICRNQFMEVLGDIRNQPLCLDHPPLVLCGFRLMPGRLGTRRCCDFCVGHGHNQSQSRVLRRVAGRSFAFQRGGLAVESVVEGPAGDGIERQGYVFDLFELRGQLAAIFRRVES
jgi:hypothetical protein